MLFVSLLIPYPMILSFLTMEEVIVSTLYHVAPQTVSVKGNLGHLLLCMGDGVKELL